MMRSLRHLIARPACRSLDTARKLDLISRWVRWQQRRKGVELMLSLPDHLLKDIGLMRSEIEDASRGRYDALSANSNAMRSRGERQGEARLHLDSRRGVGRRLGGTR